jgi:hypothetical protein
MSGGSLDYAYSKINTVKEEIESLIAKDFKNKYDDYEYDYLNELTPEQRKEFIESMKKLSNKLKTISEELYALEWFLSGDYGYETYIKEVDSATMYKQEYLDAIAKATREKTIVEIIAKLKSY